MPWPGHLKPLPSFIDSPIKYFHCVTNCHDTVLINTFCISLSHECGGREKYFDILVEASMDMIRWWKKYEIHTDMSKEHDHIINMNHEKYHKKIRALIRQ